MGLIRLLIGGKHNFGMIGSSIAVELDDDENLGRNRLYLDWDPLFEKIH
jgi:hypothetical protein